MNDKQEKTIKAIQEAFPASPFYVFPYSEAEKARNEPWKARILFTDRLDPLTGEFLGLNLKGQPRDKNHLRVNGRRVSLTRAISYIEGVRNFF